MSSSDTPTPEATAAPTPAAPARPAVVKPKHTRGPNRPVVLVQTAVVILVLLTLCEVALGPLSRHFPPGLLDQPREIAVKKRQLDALEGQAVDVLFMGDSIMDGAGDAKIFGAASTHFDTAYNGALLGAPFIGQISWLRRVVLPRIKPRVIIEMVSPLALTAPEAEGFGENVLDENVDIEINRTDESFWLDLDRSASEVSHLVRYRHSLRQPDVVVEAVQDMINGEPAKADRPNVIRGKYAEPGYWDRSIAADGRYLDFNSLGLPAKFNASVVIPLVDAEPDFATFDQLISYERSTGTQVVVAIAPLALGAYEASGVDVAKFRALAERVATRARDNGVPVIDLTEAGFVRTDFNDYLHLNDAGARRFSTEVAKRLDELCTAGAVDCA